MVFSELFGIEGPKKIVAELELANLFRVRDVCDWVRVRGMAPTVGCRRLRGDSDSEDVVEELDRRRERTL